MIMARNLDRRDFLKYTASAGSALALGYSKSALALPKKSANSKVVVSVAGLHGRGKKLAQKFALLENVEVKYVVDVDSRYFADAIKTVEEVHGKKPVALRDYRKSLDDKDIDAIVIATPDHWHAPMSIEALKAGKHVYVEKPCSHNPYEGELLVAAQRKYGKIVQMGNQRRSIDFVRQMVKELSSGLIGNIYLAKCFYTRKRKPIGFGKEVTVPVNLDWELWQGPAPRVNYKDNLHPYNWHWFWNWGTGEALNNGVHMLDIARWVIKSDYPVKVSSLGGRWHYKGVDDWQCPDTQEIMLEFDKGRMITWFGRSTNTFGQNYKPFGILFFGSEGIVDYDGANEYRVYDLDNNMIKKAGDSSKSKTDQRNTTDPGFMDKHAPNFIRSIRGLEKLTSPIDIGHKSTLMGHLGNISLRTGRTLYIDKRNGHILNDPEAMKLWQRTYEPGWEPKV
jgi:predicted dehydrogenase